MIYEVVHFTVSGAENTVRIKDLDRGHAPCFFFPIAFGYPDEIVSHFAIIAEAGAYEIGAYEKWLDETFGAINGDLTSSEFSYFIGQDLTCPQMVALEQGYRATLEAIKPKM